MSFSELLNLRLSGHPYNEKNVVSTPQIDRKLERHTAYRACLEQYPAQLRAVTLCMCCLKYINKQPFRSLAKETILKFLIIKRLNH